jgi:dTDP-4-dehydrorhamnose reductase
VTKLEAETLVQTLPESDFVIARPSVIYGSTPAAGKVNFALWLIETLRKGEHVRIVTDQWNTPTLNTNLAEMTLEIVGDVYLVYIIRVVLQKAASELPVKISYWFR